MMTPMQKSASKAQAIKRVLKNPAFQGAVLAAPMTYAEYQGYNPFMEDLKNRNPTPVQKGTAYLMNTIGLASLLNPKRKVPAGIATMATMLTTPLMHAGGSGIKGMEQSVDRLTNLTKVEEDRQRLLRRLGVGGLALGGAAALGGLSLARRAVRNAEKPKPVPVDPGRVRVTLPTRDPSDVETHVELPLDHPLLTQTNVRKLRRDLRQRLRDESKERRLLRSERRRQDLEEDDDMEKSADILAFSRSLTKQAKFPQGPDSLMRPPMEGQPAPQGPDPAMMKQQQAMQGQMQQLQQENAQLQQQLQQVDEQVQQQSMQVQQEAEAVVQQTQMEAQQQVQKLQQQNAQMQQELNAQKQEAQLAKHEAQLASRSAELKAQERELSAKGKTTLSPALLNQAKLLNSHIGRLSKGASTLKKKDFESYVVRNVFRPLKKKAVTFDGVPAASQNARLPVRNTTLTPPATTSTASQFLPGPVMPSSGGPGMQTVRAQVGPAPYAIGAPRAPAGLLPGAKPLTRWARFGRTLNRVSGPLVAAMEMANYADHRQGYLDEGRTTAEANRSAAVSTGTRAVGSYAGYTAGTWGAKKVLAGKGAAKGAVIGTAIGGPLGTVAGGIIGGVAGLGTALLGSWALGKAGDAITNTNAFHNKDEAEKRHIARLQQQTEAANAGARKQQAALLYGNPGHGGNLHTQNRWGGSQGATTGVGAYTGGYGGTGATGSIGSFFLPLISSALSGPPQPSFPQNSQPRVHRGGPPGGY